MREYRNGIDTVLLPGVEDTPASMFFYDKRKERRMMRLLVDESIRRHLNPLFLLEQFCVSDIASYIDKKSAR